MEKRHCPIDGDKIKSCIKCKTCAIMNGFGGAGTKMYSTAGTNFKKLCLQNKLKLLDASVRHLGTGINYVILENLLSNCKIRNLFHFAYRCAAAFFAFLCTSCASLRNIFNLLPASFQSILHRRLDIVSELQAEQHSLLLLKNRHPPRQYTIFGYLGCSNPL